MIAAAVVMPRKIRQLAADPRQSRVARQLAQLAGHLPAMIAVRMCRPCFAHGDADPRNKRAAGRYNEAIIAIPARLIIKLGTHNRLTKNN